MPAVNLTRETWLASRVRRAGSFPTRLLGLLGRHRLDPEEALWLVPCRAIHTLGMRFPIDVVFLDDQERVVALLESLAPWRLSPLIRPAHSALELRAGTIRKSSTRVGDELEVSAAAAATLDDLRENPLATNRAERSAYPRERGATEAGNAGVASSSPAERWSLR